MPEDLTVLRVESDQIGAVAGKEQVTCRRKHVGCAAATGPVMTPGNLTGFVIDGEKCTAFPARSGIDATVALGMVIGIGLVVDAPGFADSDIEQSGIRTKTRRL